MAEGINEDHLSAEEVLTLLGFVSEHKPIIVGGQSVNIWSELFQGQDQELDELGSLTSKDLDFYENEKAQKALTASLIDGKLLIPSPDDQTPNASVVIGKIGDKQVEIDFLKGVQGVDGKALLKKSVTFQYGDTDVSVTLMHPIDCVTSRLANINTLHRKSEHSINQAIASVRILDCFIQNALEMGDKTGHRIAIDALNQLEYILKDDHIGKASDTEFGEMLQIAVIFDKYMNDDRLDTRYRERQLSGIIERTAERYRARENRRALLDQDLETALSISELAESLSRNY